MLAAYGLDDGAFDARALEPGLALERLAAGKLDAFFALGALPLAAVARVNAIAEIRLLPVSAERLAGDEELAALMRPASVPAGTYPGLPAVETVATTELLVVADGLDADLVHAIAARLWAAEAVSRWRTVQPGSFAIEGALDPLVVPLHPGAERFYRERGVLP